MMNIKMKNENTIVVNAAWIAKSIDAAIDTNSTLFFFSTGSISLWTPRERDIRTPSMEEVLTVMNGEIQEWERQCNTSYSWVLKVSPVGEETEPIGFVQLPDGRVTEQDLKTALEMVKHVW